jgi:hypothetical protein
LHVQLAIMDSFKQTYDNCGRWGMKRTLSQKWEPFSWLVTGESIMYMVLETVIYFALAVLIDVLLSYPSIRARVLPDKNVPEPPHQVRDSPADLCPWSRWW